MRLSHIVKTAENVGLLKDELPLDIQKLMLDAKKDSNDSFDEAD